MYREVKLLASAYMTLAVNNGKSVDILLNSFKKKHKQV